LRRVYLAHPSGYQGDLERVRSIMTGAEALHPEDRFRHGVRRDSLSPASRAALVAGDVLRPPADIVWVVGQLDGGVASDMAAAERAGIPIVPLNGAAEELWQAGRAVQARREEDATRRVVDRVLAELIKRPDFRGARAVVSSYFLAETWELGGGGLDYERAVGAASSGTGGRAFRDSVEGAALRLTRASALVRDAELTPVELAALRAREVEGRSYRQVALALGWPDDGRSDDTARRRCLSGLRKVDRALRASEREDE